VVPRSNKVRRVGNSAGGKTEIPVGVGIRLVSLLQDDVSPALGSTSCNIEAKLVIHDGRNATFFSTLPIVSPGFGQLICTCRSYCEEE
jgi:hypothetical protein